MFVMKTEHTFTWPVRIKVPVDGGEFKDATFDCTFRTCDHEDFMAIVDGRISEADFLRKVTVGPWSGVEDASGKEMPFSEAARDRLIAIPYVRTALVRAYREAMSGQAVAKN